MRVLEINTERGWRGGEKQTLLTVEELLSKGIPVTLICKKHSSLHQKAISSQITHIPVSSNVSLFFFLLFNARAFDIIHTHTAKSLTPCVLSKFFHKTKIVFSRRHYKTPSSWFSKWKYNQADYITTVSEYIKTSLISAGVTIPIRVIYDASVFVEPNTERIERDYADYTHSHKKIIATVAAFEEEKDPLTLVKAIYQLSLLRNDFIFLHIGSGSIQSKIKEYVLKKNMQSVYFFLGQTTQVEELYSMFDVFVMSSKNEGFGSSVIDAFLNNIPVVSTRAGGLTELVMNRGYLAQPADAESLCKALQSCLTNNNNSITEDAYTFAVTALSTQTIQEQYIRLFSELTQPAIQPS